MKSEINRPIDATKRQEDTVEVALRPQSLAEFIGQKSSRENLSIFIEAARQRDEALDHVLLHGPPGLWGLVFVQHLAL